MNWYDCIRWCNARSQKEGLTPCYYTDAALSAVYKTGSLDIGNERVRWNANGYRLPTQAEWEKAARGGRQGRLFPWGGDTISHAQANYFSTNIHPYNVSPPVGFHPAHTNGGMPYTSAAATFLANGYGLHDVAGNVYEWCWDWYGAYTADPQTDPLGPAGGTARVARGGCWAGWPSGARVAYQLISTTFPPTRADWTLGFRSVRGR